MSGASNQRTAPSCTTRPAPVPYLRMIDVFIENEAKKAVKHIYNEETGELVKEVEVSRPYPFAYGYVVGTKAEDGGGLDCFVISTKRLKTGRVVEVDPIAVLEQFENGQPDHNIIAVMPDQDVDFTPGDKAALREFIEHVFDHKPGLNVTTGKLLGKAEAMEMIEKYSLKN